jgi:hypothetical protein
MRVVETGTWALLNNERIERHTHFPVIPGSGPGMTTGGLPNRRAYS